MNAERVRLDVVIPVYNEEQALEHSISCLREYLQAQCPYDWCIVIADNASTDRTFDIARQLQARWPEQVQALHLAQKGRGRALRTAWLASDANVMSYMDADLSTDLAAFLPLIEPLRKVSATWLSARVWPEELRSAGRRCANGPHACIIC